METTIESKPQRTIRVLLVLSALAVVAAVQGRTIAGAEDTAERAVDEAVETESALDLPAAPVVASSGASVGVPDTDVGAGEQPYAQRLPVTGFFTLAGVGAADLRVALEDLEAERRADPIAVAGRVVGADGPIAGAVIAIGDHTAISDASGRFELSPVDRTNRIMSITADGHVGRTVGAQGEQDLGTDVVRMGDITLIPTARERHTMIFGGDSSLGRRYINPDEDAPRDELPKVDPNALIGLDSSRQDTNDLLADLARIVEPYDLVSINLETVVTDEPSGPEETQRYVLYMLPGSVDALADAGIDHVSLGNNHVWDYGEKGVSDTHAALDEAGISYSGSGANADEAFAPHVVDDPDLSFDIALHSWVAIENIPAPYPPHATDTKGGGANLNDLDRVAAEVEATEAAGMLTVAIPHVGYEYTEQPAPSDPVQFVQERLDTAADAGADLVIAHHPHLAQGFEIRNGTLVAHSLGNLIFDQPRLDTLFGAMLAVTFDGQELVHARVEPVYIEGFKTTLAVGEPADQLLRRLAYLGDPELVLSPDAGAARITTRAEATVGERTIELVAEPDENGTMMIDLRTLRLPGESIGFVHGVDQSSVSVGRDIMVLGDMEDHDFDDDPAEIRPWNFGTSSMVCGSQARRGAGAICSIRDDGNSGASTISFGQRIRVVGDRINQPNRDITLLVYERGLNRGDLVIEASYRASQGSRQFGDEILATLPARNGDYAQHWIGVNLPPEDQQYIDELPPDRPFRMRPQFRSARAVRLSFKHFPPEEGTGLLALDDLALVSWEQPEPLDGSYRTPSPFDFVRVENVESGDRLELTFHSWTAEPVG